MGILVVWVPKPLHTLVIRVRWWDERERRPRNVNKDKKFVGVLAHDISSLFSWSTRLVLFCFSFLFLDIFHNKIRSPPPKTLANEQLFLEIAGASRPAFVRHREADQPVLRPKSAMS